MKFVFVLFIRNFQDQLVFFLAETLKGQKTQDTCKCYSLLYGVIDGFKHPKTKEY